MAQRDLPAAALALALGMSTGCSSEQQTGAAADAAKGGVAAPGTSQGAASPAAPSTTPPAMPVYRQIGDFVVACDNGLRCEVIGIAEDGARGLELRLLREAGPHGAQHLRLRPLDAGVEVPLLRLDGAEASAFSALPWKADGAAPGGLRLDDSAAIGQFIAGARDASRLGHGDGANPAGLSLSGFSAALQLVDELQQRLDTQGAWLRRGARSDATVPAAPALPQLPAAPPAPVPLPVEDVARLTLLVRDSQADALLDADCQARSRDYDITAGDTAVALGAHEALVFATCLSGAYQVSSLVFRIDRDGAGQVQRVIPPVPPGLADIASDMGMLTNAAYEPDTATLSHFAKGRGLADCGESASWRFDGKTFQLASYSILSRCGGVAPGDWPSLWRTQD